MNWRRELLGPVGVVLAVTGLRLLVIAIAEAEREGWHRGSQEQIQLCKEAGHYEPCGSPTREQGDVPGDAPRPS